MTNVLVLGDAILDHYQFGVINRYSPEDTGVSVVDITSEEYRLGGCLNVAANIKSISFPEWGNTTDKQFNVFLSSIFSRFTGALLYTKGILCDDSNIVGENRGGDLQPSKYELIKTRIVNVNGNKQLIRVDNRLKYNKEDIKLYKETLDLFSKKYDAIIVSDYNKGLIDEFLIESLKQFKGPVFVDSKNPNLKMWNSIYNCFIKINNREWKLANDTIHPLIITRGKDGALLKINCSTTEFPTKKVKDPDVVGCGDVFLAGLVVKYLRTNDLHKSINFANMVAGMSAQKQGTTEIYLY